MELVGCKDPRTREPPCFFLTHVEGGRVTPTDAYMLLFLGIAFGRALDGVQHREYGLLWCKSLRYG